MKTFKKIAFAMIPVILALVVYDTVWSKIRGLVFGLFSPNQNMKKAA